MCANRANGECSMPYCGIDGAHYHRETADGDEVVRVVRERTTLIRSSSGAVVGVEVYGLYWRVVIDPDLPERGIVLYHPERIIKLREWDSEVFLHELIHIAFAVAPDKPGVWWRPDFNGNLRLTDAEQELFVQHLSHLLDDIGYRLEATT